MREPVSNEFILFANQFLQSNFQLELDIPIYLSKGHRIYGRFRYNRRLKQPVHILVSQYIYEQDKQLTKEILKHELVHYALSKLGKPFQDKDDYFQSTCKKLNILLEIPDQLNTSLFCHYQCACNQPTKHIYKTKFRARRICTACSSPLVFSHLGPRLNQGE